VRPIWKKGWEKQAGGSLCRVSSRGSDERGLMPQVVFYDHQFCIGSESQTRGGKEDSWLDRCKLWKKKTSGVKKAACRYGPSSQRRGKRERAMRAISGRNQRKERKEFGHKELKGGYCGVRKGAQTAMP